MTIEDRLKRSKQPDSDELGSISCKDVDEPLVRTVSSERLDIVPIWEEMVDDIEGPLYEHYINEHPSYDAVFVRKAVKARLEAAAKALPKQLKLVLRAAHRPVEVQLALLSAVSEQYRQVHPAASNEEVLKHARTFVSDPALKLPPHCCGAAVDVDVLDTQTGQLLDFGCPMNTDSEVAFLHSSLLTKEQAANRLILLKAMLSAGFASLSAEWWHFSYGDQAWAHFYDQPQSLYGIIEPEL